jgi:hypothetical protein
MGTAPLLPADVEIQAFQPVAYYDQHADCIRVYTHDRSVTERRVDEYLTIYRVNHASPFDPEHAGFCLKGVRHLFHEMGLDLTAVYSLTEVIDRLVKHKPDAAMSSMLTSFVNSFPVAEQLRIKVEVRVAA